MHMCGVWNTSQTNLPVRQVHLATGGLILGLYPRTHTHTPMAMPDVCDVWVCVICDTLQRRAYFVIPSASPNGSYDSISPHDVLEVVELALLQQKR